MSEPKFNIGDLVRIDGIERLYKVDGIIVEQHFYSNKEWTDVFYEIKDIETRSILDADEFELSLVSPADKAEEYLKDYKPKGGDEPVFDFEPIRKPKPTPENERYNKQLERERKINELLDERNDMDALYKSFGDRKYKARIEEIDKELRKIE
jgi:signal peptidase I